MHPDEYSERCHIYENLQFFWTLTYLKPTTYSEPSQRFKMEFFAKIVKSYNYLQLLFCSVFDFLTSYSNISSHIVAYLEPCVTLAYSDSWHIYNPRNIQNSVKAYSGLFRSLCNACMWRTRHLEFWHIYDRRYIQNPVHIEKFRNIQGYSIMTVIQTLTFFFFTWKLHWQIWDNLQGESSLGV